MEKNFFKQKKSSLKRDVYSYDIFFSQYFFFNFAEKLENLF